METLPTVETLRVSGKSRPNAVAGAIAALLRAQGRAEVNAIGPAAVNQAVKALAIARGYLEGNGLDLAVQPAFVTLDVADEERTAMTFRVWAVRPNSHSP
ncbi:stage V sporulation protein S [Deinococcus metallilatus]|nr:stage V sporulation protein S [Deinococcus metallilatus]QBY10324.1 stage V sporulation protein S [Deinococcus metallilatus]RXJ10282.1 stage V sporulation protein S [Deinococcus metallilatus]TLK28132.1 stage V sporulation protein S [Deinococcus metallilatus]